MPYEIVRNFLEQFLFAKSERVSQEMVEAYLAAQQPNAEYAALAFCGRPYFDLALYIQLAVPTIMLWGVGAHLPASI